MGIYKRLSSRVVEWGNVVAADSNLDLILKFLRFVEKEIFFKLVSFFYNITKEKVAKIYGVISRNAYFELVYL